MRAGPALLVAAALLGGCRFTVGHLGSVTPSAGTHAAPRPGPRRVTGRDCVPIVVVAPTRWPSLDRAAQRALADGGQILTDVVIRYELRYFPLVFGYGCYVMEGTAS